MSTVTPGIVKPSITVDMAEVETFANETTVANNILKTLGKIPGYYAIRCIRVFNNRFRVNVFVNRAGKGEFLPDTVIAYSFFVVANPDGSVVKSIPALPSH